MIHSTGFPDSEEAKKGRTASAGKIDKDGIDPFVDGLVPKLFAPENVETYKHLDKGKEDWLRNYSSKGQ